jgi:hypothetical protein
VTQRDAVGRGPERKLGEERVHVGFEHSTRPAQAGSGERDAALVTQAPERNQVVVSRHTASGQREHAPDALVGQRPVTDQIAGAEVAVELLRREKAEHRVERVRVRMDVRNDPVAHKNNLNLRLTLRDCR